MKNKIKQVACVPKLMHKTSYHHHTEEPEEEEEEGPRLSSTYLCAVELGSAMVGYAGFPTAGLARLGWAGLGGLLLGRAGSDRLGWSEGSPDTPKVPEGPGWLRWTVLDWTGWLD